MGNFSQEICTKYFSSLKGKITNLEKRVGGKVIFFDGELNSSSAFHFHKVLRKLTGKKLFLVLESPGGHIDSAAKIIHMCKQYFKEFNVVVPSYAKSAATLICVSADNLFLGSGGEMGPVDPQVLHPLEQKTYIPALSIKDALEFIESSNDPYVKIGLTEKIDPYLMGAYRRVIKLAEQYLHDAHLVKTSKSPKEVIDALTHKYISHGYPIDIQECEKLGIPLKKFKDEKIMDEVYDLFEEYIDFTITHSERLKIGLLILSSNLCMQKIKIIADPLPATISNLKKEDSCNNSLVQGNLLP
ncbi:Serine dehydrogenase proteinase [uncultured archaeon]|nr:Serine dehydrogenase proteinase [uncultured archaeon]